MGWTAAEAMAKSQHGLITRAQLRDSGISDSTLGRGLREQRLMCVVSKVYRFALTPPTWDLRARAALMIGKPGDVLSHGSAAALWGLLGFERRADATIHVSRTGRAPWRLGEGYQLHRPLRPFAPFKLDGLPVTRLARTVVDLAGELEEERLEMLLDAAHRRRPRLQRWLKEELEPLAPARYPGVSTLKRLFQLRAGVAVESPLETKIRRFVRERGVVEPTYQLNVFDDLGFIMRVDAAWEAHRIALHGDSWEWHGNRQAFDDDAAKRRRLVAAGWASVAVTSTDLKGDAWFRAVEQLLHDRAPQRSFFPFTVRAGSGPGQGGRPMNVRAPASSARGSLDAGADRTVQPPSTSLPLFSAEELGSVAG